MKKMGRPSRKGTATTITFEDPEGQIFFFSINSHGKSQLLDITNANVGFGKDFKDKTLTLSSSSECLAAMSAEFANSAEQNKMFNPDVQKITEINEKLDLFLEKINRKINVEKTLRENAFTLNLLPPIII